mmetsp:Transcript_6794/g.7711  ORF Transcript_6794/g.7711 Transcript_6794/m.7711 type:complete len:87 (-) Transcript_6794:117-377(-)
MLRAEKKVSLVSQPETLRNSFHMVALFVLAMQDEQSRPQPRWLSPASFGQLCVSGFKLFVVGLKCGDPLVAVHGIQVVYFYLHFPL